MKKTWTNIQMDEKEKKRRKKILLLLLLIILILMGSIWVYFASMPEKEIADVSAETGEKRNASVVGTWNVSKTTNGNDNVTATLTSDGIFTFSGRGNMKDWASYFSNRPWNSKTDQIQEVVIENDVTNIGNYAFYQCRNLTKMNISSSVTTIGEGVFSRM